jgi:hypothetical protein
LKEIKYGVLSSVSIFRQRKDVKKKQYRLSISGSLKALRSCQFLESGIPFLWFRYAKYICNFKKSQEEGKLGPSGLIDLASSGVKDGERGGLKEG